MFNVQFSRLSVRSVNIIQSRGNSVFERNLATAQGLSLDGTQLKFELYHLLGSGAAAVPPFINRIILSKI